MVFRVRLLGRLGLERDGAPLDTDRWPPRARMFFTLLAVAPERRRSRDELIDILWPEASPEAGWSNLRYTLHLLRRAFGADNPSPVLVERGWITLNPVFDWELDLEQFERLVLQTGEDREALERVAQLYAGEPLMDHRYDDWAAPVRERVQGAWRNLCLRLGVLHGAAGSHDVAAQWFERVLDDDPLDEEALRGLIGALSAQGHRTQAVRRYRQFEQLLRAEVDLPPEQETQALVEQVKVQLRKRPVRSEQALTHDRSQPIPVVPSYPLPAIAPMVGRDAELGAILSALPRAEARAPRPRLLLLSAEAGMGKTRLLAEAAERARSEGILTLAGGSYEPEGQLPFSPIHDALLDYVRAQPEAALRAKLEGLLPEVARIVPELHARLSGVEEPWSGDAENRRLALFSAMEQILARIGEERGLVLLLDDLHWADAGTLELLHFIVRRSERERVLIVGAYREEEVRQSELLDHLVRLGDAHVRHLALAPLVEAELRTVLEEWLRQVHSLTVHDQVEQARRAGLHPSLVRSLHERSQGNPFFAVQMLELLQQEGQLEPTEEGRRLTPGTAIEVPPAVRETVARRLRRLGPDEREALTLGAVLGPEFGYAPLEAMWEGAERELFQALDMAVDAHLVMETGEGYAFRHPLLWEVVYRRAPPPRRMILHERAALALERIFGDRTEEHAMELARHFLAAGRVHLDRAMRYVILAGDQAEDVFAHEEAEKYYRTALELAREVRDQARAASVLEKLGAVLRTVGRYDEALELLTQAVELYAAIRDLEGERRSLAEIGRAHAGKGSFADGIARLESALASLGEAIPSEGLAAIYLSLASLYFQSGRYPDQLSAAERAGEIARAIGNDRTLVQAELVRGFALHWTERRADFRQVMEDVVRLAENIGHLPTLASALSALVTEHADAGELKRARLYAARALEIQQRLGDLYGIAFGMFVRGLLAYWSGDWDEAQASFERSLSLYREVGSVEHTRIPMFGLGMVHMRRGDREAGARYLENHIALARQTGDLRYLYAAEALLVEREILEGRADAARARLELVLSTSDPPTIEAARVRVVLAWAYLEIGDEIKALELVADALGRIDARVDREVAAEALRIRGMIMSRKRWWEEARWTFESILPLTDAMIHPYARARALHEYGMMLVDQGDERGARAQYKEACTIFQRLGARKDLEGTQQALVGLDQG